MTPSSKKRRPSCGNRELAFPLWVEVSAQPGVLQSAEALRRRAYLRLARTIGISWLDCRRVAPRRG